MNKVNKALETDQKSMHCGYRRLHCFGNGDTFGYEKTDKVKKTSVTQKGTPCLALPKLGECAVHFNGDLTRVQAKLHA